MIGKIKLLVWNSDYLKHLQYNSVKLKYMQENWHAIAKSWVYPDFCNICMWYFHILTRSKRAQTANPNPPVKMPAPDPQQCMWCAASGKMSLKNSSPLQWRMQPGTECSKMACSKMTTAMLTFQQRKRRADACSAKVLPHTVPHLVLTDSPDEEVHQEDSNNLEGNRKEEIKLWDGEEHTQMHSHMQTCKQSHVHLHMHIHTCIHTHTHTRTQLKKRKVRCVLFNCLV